MKKPEHHRSGIPVLSTQATAIVSVALVLIILGIIGLLGIAARAVSVDVRQQVGFVVMVSDDATDAEINNLKKMWSSEPYVSSVRFSSAEDVLRRWEEIGGENTTDDAELLGINPFYSEFEVGVKAAYASPEQLESIAAKVKTVAGVADVSLNTDVVRSINSTMRSLAVVLLFVAGALLLISFVLINNTVRLTVYARRFSIHTMKLVGATAGFIRRPFIWSSMVNGAIAGVLALLVLIGLIFYGASIEPDIVRVLPWEEAGVLFAALFCIGILICALSAFFAANKYLRLGYDKMFR